jgi:ATP-dependent DNA ligase
MLAAPTHTWALPPDGSVAAEPKWDGFRALAGRYDDGTPVIRSRNGTDLARYFPDVADALAAQLAPASLLDGELLVWSGGRISFDRLSARLNRTPRTVAALAEREPASLMVFDVLHLDGTPHHARPYRARRAVIEDLFASGRARPPLNLCPSTTDEATARGWLEQWGPDNVEGLVLKPTRSSYLPGRHRGGWLKWRLRDSREAVIAAVTGPPSRPGIVLLGRWDEAGQLRYLGRTARLAEVQARAVAAALRPAAPGHPWEGWTFTVSWGSRDKLTVRLVEPDTVAEVSVDVSRLSGGTWRHSVRWTRLRPDLAPADLPPFSDDR